MSSADLQYFSDFIEIPSVFYCHATQKPFEACLCCNKDLLKPEAQYVIEKVIRQYSGFTAKDVIVEYAICLECNEKLQNTLSDHSKFSIVSYFSQRVDFASRRQQLLQEKGTDIQAWLNNCLVYQAPQTELSEYQICAHCEGSNLLFTAMPFMISGQAIEEIAGLLSAETQQILDDFINQYFGLPPEIESILKNRKVIIL